MRRTCLDHFRIMGIPLVLLAASHLTAQTVGFEEFQLASESAWVGPVAEDAGTEAPGAFGGTVRTGLFHSGDVGFVNRFNVVWESLDSGFFVSNSTDNTTSGFTNDTSAFPGSGFDQSDHYAVAFGYVNGLDPTSVEQLEQLPYLDLPAHHHVVSARMTNTTYPALSMRHGDDFAKAFGGPSKDDPDFFRLRVFGTDAGQQVLDASVDVYLADFRFEDNTLDFILDEWQLVDLAPLSDASRLYFALDSSDVGAFGMNTPAYFAIDDIVTAATVNLDLDNDGVTTLTDVDLLCASLAAGDSNLAHDVNRDGTLSAADLESFLAAVDRLPGDTDWDGVVGFSDFVRLSSRFGQSGGWSHGDSNCDGQVEFDDFVRLSANYSTAAGVELVPEPGAFRLVFFAWLLGFSRLRRCAGLRRASEIVP